MTGGLEGRAKVALARDHVRRVNPWSAITAIEADLATLTPGHLAGLDVVVMAVDNERARYLGARLGLAARVPVVDGAVSAELFLARTTVCMPGAGGPCLVDGWTRDRLARAGEDVGIPCAGLDDGPPFGSTLLMAQAAGALTTHQALAVAGIVDEPAWIGHELRLDLHAGRLEQFRRSRVESCAADHELGAGEASRIPDAPGDLRLGELMDSCGVGPGAIVVLAASELVHTAACPDCGRHARPYRPEPLGPCAACGTGLVPLRRVRRVGWGEAATAVAPLGADTWFRPGDVFAVVEGGEARTFAFAPPVLAGEIGRDWDEVDDGPRLSRLPRRYDLARIRRTRIGLIGLGHLGAAILQAVAPLPWAELRLCDRDRFEIANAAAYPLVAGAAGGLSS